MADAAALWRPRRGVNLAFVGVLPFFAYALLFLLIPTVTVILGAFLDSSNRFTLANIRGLAQQQVVSSLIHSVLLSGVTAVVGAVVGAVLAYVVSTAGESSLVRRVATSASGVLTQTGGVTLAFAFIAAVGGQGFVTLLLDKVGVTGLSDSIWLFEWDKGLVLVYLYFQIPLMLIVFLPAIEGLRPQWREATETLGGSGWEYWRFVAGPILAPSFLGSVLLLFTNALSAYATAAALVSQGAPILPLNIGIAMTSEVNLGQQNLGKAMALAMVVLVAIVMTGYALLQRRTTRWLGR